MAQRTTIAQTWWQRSSVYATCCATREADPTAVTNRRGIGILSRATQPCARFISTIINPLSASSNPPLLCHGIHQREQTDHDVATCRFSIPLFMAFAILMSGLVVPTVSNFLCWLNCRVAYNVIASCHITQGIVGNNLSHNVITHMPGLPIAKSLRPPSSLHGDATTYFR